MNDRENNNNELATTDIAIAAYYMVSGLSLIDARPVRGSRGSLDCEFIFDDPEDIATSLRIKYAGSAEQTYDAKLRYLRKIVNEVRRDFGR